MFKIVRNGKIYGKIKFDSYEEARSYARKAIRRYMSMLNAKPYSNDIGGMLYNNPSINLYGYSVIAA